MKWSQILPEPIMQIGDQLAEKANQLRNQVNIYPPADQVFRALKLTPPDQVKVCIIGQDPYHTPGAANGLAFSINKGRYIQPSLQNIFKELCDDIHCDMPSHGDLTCWAEQGVLLLNTSLTVEQGKPNSHSDWGWDTFTQTIFKTCLSLPQPIVFILWGRNAQNIASDVDWSQYTNKCVIKSPHPSPMSAAKGFFGSKPFSRTNAFLIAHGSSPITWTIPA